MAELKKGDTLETKNFMKVQVKKLLGDGGQGWVYLVDYNGKDMALKWYKPGAIKDPVKFQKNLKNNIEVGAPSEAFLWPLDYAEKGDDFGYVMELRPPAYKDFSAILLGKEVIKTLDADGNITKIDTPKLRWPGIGPMVTAAMNISAGFRALHAKGYSYQDLNDGNFFINFGDPAKYGDVLICDNDNVSAFAGESGIAGKARYMAPEVVLGTNKPDRKTDAFSLAVILFRLFIIDHPLEGEAYLSVPCLTDAYERKLFGENPVFIHDPTDTSNRPVPDIHQGAIKRWPFLPQYARDMFTKAFSKQVMKDRAYRILEIDWIKLFIRMRGEVWKCPSCGDVYFADPVNPNPCPSCKKPTNFSFYIKTESGYCVPAHQRTVLYQCHTGSKPEEGFNIKTAEIMVRGNDLGLTNLTNVRWSRIKDGNQIPVEPGKTAKLEKGVRLDFGGGASAEII